MVAGAAPNITNAEGDTCLHGAITADCNKETLQAIIDYGADVNATNKRGRTPLLLSCFFRQIDSVNVLLAAGADTTICDEEGFSCLHAAIDGRCSKDTLQALIDHGAHIDTTRKDGANALLRACYTGQSESVRFLLEAGADESIVTPNGNTCLHYAIRGNCTKDTLEKIIEQGVDANYMNHRGDTALIRAYSTAQTESVNVLLEKGADPNIVNSSGFSSLHAAAAGNCPSKTVQEISKCKIDLDAKDKDGRTALLLACMHRQQETVQVLLEAGSNPNIRDNNGQTSLMKAAISGCRKKVIQAIIDRGNDVNATSKYNDTALMWACDQRNEAAIHVLLKAGADTNTEKKIGWRCLIHAVDKHCCTEVLQALIDHGADVHPYALEVADRRRQTDGVMSLLKAGAQPCHLQDPGTLFLEIICFIIPLAIILWFDEVVYISLHEFWISYIVWCCLLFYCIWDYMFFFLVLRTIIRLLYRKLLSAWRRR